MRRPPSWFRRCLFGAVLCLLVVYGALAAVALRYGVHVIQRVVGRELTVEAARLSWPLTVTLTGLRLATNTAVSAMSLPEVVVWPRGLSLTTKTVTLDSLELRQPLVRVTRTPEGTIQWPTLPPLVSAMAQAASLNWRVEIRSLHISEGIVEFIDEATGHTSRRGRRAEAPPMPFHGVLEHLVVDVGPVTIPRPGAVADPTPWRVASGDRSAQGRASRGAASTRAWDEGNSARSAGPTGPAPGRGTIPTGRTVFSGLPTDPLSGIAGEGPGGVSCAIRGQFIGHGGHSAPLYCSGWVDGPAGDLHILCRLEEIALAAFEPYYHGPVEVRPYQMTVSATGQWWARSNDFTGRIQVALHHAEEGDLSIGHRTLVDFKKLLAGQEPRLSGEIQLSGPLDRPSQWQATFLPGDARFQRMVERLRAHGVEVVTLPFWLGVLQVSLSVASDETMEIIEASSQAVEEALNILTMAEPVVEEEGAPAQTAPADLTSPHAGAAQEGEVPPAAAVSGEPVVAPQGASSPPPSY